MTVAVNVGNVLQSLQQSDPNLCVLQFDIDTGGSVEVVISADTDDTVHADHTEVVDAGDDNTGMDEFAENEEVFDDGEAAVCKVSCQN